MNIKVLLKQITPYFVVFLIMLLPRIFRLDSFVATDEGAWLIRSANFYYALGQRQFSETYLNGSIAVFTMWINTLAFLIRFPAYRGFGQGYVQLYDRKWEEIFTLDQVSELSILSTGRTIMVFALIIVGLVIFWYLKRNLGTFPAIFSFMLMSFDPFYIALSRTSHLDAPMGTFLILSILAYQTYLSAGRKSYDIIISGTAGALSMLSKIPGIFVIPGIIGVSFITYFRNYRKLAVQKVDIRKTEVVFYLKTITVWLMIFSIVFILAWPAMWSQPIKTIQKLFVQTSNFVDVEAIDVETDIDQADAPSGISNPIDFILKISINLIKYLVSFLWRTTPILLLGLIWSILGYWKKLDLLAKESVRSLVVMLVFTSIYLLIFMSVFDKRSEKYIIPVHLALDIVAGIGWVGFFAIVSNRFKVSYRKWITYSFVLIIFLAQAIIVWDHYPYYFSYYNPLLGGSKRAGEVRAVGVGEGLDQAAQYLNQLPDAENLRVLSWYGKGPFSFFFEGETATIFTGTRWNEEFINKISSSDYLVIYSNQRYRRTPTKLFDILDDIEPIHRVWIEEIEYARIYDVDDILAILQVD